MKYTIYYYNWIVIDTRGENILNVIIYWFNYAMKNEFVDIEIEYIASEYGDIYKNIQLPKYEKD